MYPLLSGLSPPTHPFLVSELLDGGVKMGAHLDAVSFLLLPGTSLFFFLCKTLFFGQELFASIKLVVCGVIFFFLARKGIQPGTSSCFCSDSLCSFLLIFLLFNLEHSWQSPLEPRRGTHRGLSKQLSLADQGFLVIWRLSCSFNLLVLVCDLRDRSWLPIIFFR